MKITLEKKLRLAKYLAGTLYCSIAMLPLPAVFATPLWTCDSNPPNGTWSCAIKTANPIFVGANTHIKQSQTPIKTTQSTHTATNSVDASRKTTASKPSNSTPLANDVHANAVPVATKTQSPTPSPQQPTPTSITAMDKPIRRTQAKIIEQLGWVSTPYHPHNICGGYYLAMVLPPKQGNIAQNKSPIQISADQSTFSQTGTSILSGNVEVTRPERQLNADRVYIYRNSRTGKVIALDSYGDVTLRQPGVLVFGTHGHSNFITNTGYLENALYRFSMVPIDSQRQIQNGAPTPATKTDATDTTHHSEVANNQSSDVKTVKLSGTTGWGIASIIKRLRHNVLELKNSTYTTCPPNTHIWDIKSSTLDLDQEQGVGNCL